MLPALLLAAETCNPRTASCRDTTGPGLGLKLFVIVASSAVGS